MPASKVRSVRYGSNSGSAHHKRKPEVYTEKRMKSIEQSDKETERNLLTGKIWPQVLVFALPLALTGMLQQLFNAADIAVLGQFVGKNAMAAVGSNSAVIGLLVNLFVGVSVGANVVISNFTGQQNRRMVSKATHTAVVLAVICGVIITVIGEIIAAPMIHLLGVPAEISPMAEKYLRIYFFGMPFIMLYNFESAIFRSQGNTRTPLLCLAISGVLNVALNLFFVLVMGMDVDGVALATVIANVLSSTMMFVFLTKEKSAIRVSRSNLHMNPVILGNILRIGLPSGFQGMVFSISNLVIQSAINSLGADVVAASSAAFNIEIFAYYIINSFGQAAVTFVGQNYGAGNLKRCRQITRQVLLLDEIFTIAVAVIIVAFGRPLLMIFNSDPTVLELGYIRIVVIVSTEVLNVVIEVLSGSMRGYGSSLIPAIVAFVGICGVRIVWVYTVFAHSHTWMTLMLAYPVSWGVTMLIMILAYFRERRQIQKRVQQGSSFRL